MGFPEQVVNLIPDRITKLIDHPVQLRLRDDPIRFKTCSAGRRSGKTERFKRKIVAEALKVPGMYFAAAPVRDQAKRLFWRDLKLMSPTILQSKVPSESELIISYINGSELHVIGLDKPERVEGIPWRGGGVDEIANCKGDIWDAHLRPLFSTRGMEDSWCWLFGVPEGLNHFYDLTERGKSDEYPDWAFYSWFSSDILDPQEIADAKRSMDPKFYRQEYEGSFETISGRVYFDYGNANHTDRLLEPGKDIVWTHDFNFTPLSSAILQIDKAEDEKGVDKIYMVDEIILESAVAQNTAMEFVNRYEDYKSSMVHIYGDAQGHHGEKHNQQSDYLQIEKILKQHGFRTQMHATRNYRPIKESQSSLRAKVLNAQEERSFFVNAVKCPYGDKGMKLTQLKKGSTFQEEDGIYQHITTALRYFTDVAYPIRGKSSLQEASW